MEAYSCPSQTPNPLPAPAACCPCPCPCPARHRAAEAAYSGSSLMEALKLYQKAAHIAEILADSMGGSVHGARHDATKG